MLEIFKMFKFNLNSFNYSNKIIHETKDYNNIFIYIN